MKDLPVLVSQDEARARYQNRTGDPNLTMVVLYRLSQAGIVCPIYSNVPFFVNKIC